MSFPLASPTFTAPFTVKPIPLPLFLFVPIINPLFAPTIKLWSVSTIIPCCSLPLKTKDQVPSIITAEPITILSFLLTIASPAKDREFSPKTSPPSTATTTAPVPWVAECLEAKTTVSEESTWLAFPPITTEPIFPLANWLFSPPTIRELSDHQFPLPLPAITAEAPPASFFSFPTLSSTPTDPTPSTKPSWFLSQIFFDEEVSLRWTSWICCVAVYLLVSIIIGASSFALDWATIQIPAETKRTTPQTANKSLTDGFFILFKRLENKHLGCIIEIIVIFYTFANFFMFFSEFSLESKK